MLRRIVLALSAVVSLMGAGAHNAQAQLIGTGPFSGLYFGVHGGYTWDAGGDTTVAGSVINSSLGGSLVGGHVGYNLQLGQLLIGAEADYSWSRADTAISVPGTTFTTKLDSLWSVRGRLGYVVANSVLLYGTAGYGGFDTSLKGTLGPFANLSANAKTENFVVGGGAELLLTRNLMLRAEGLFYGGSDNKILSDVTVLRLGASYKF